MNPFARRIQKADHSDENKTVSENTEFALELYQKLRTSTGNLFFSPYSISMALAMTYAGARGNTETQMAQALHFPLDQEQLYSSFAALRARLDQVELTNHVQLRIVNSLFPGKRYTFLDEFLVLTKQFYGAVITPLDYGNPEAARQAINAWVEEKTEGKIKDLISPGILNPLTQLVLVNAIYFKGNWANPFYENITSDAPFWVTADSQVNARMMSQKDEFQYAEYTSLQILELPYAGNGLSMIVLLPKEIDGLEKLEESLTPEILDRWINNLRKREIIVYLPKFAITFPFRLDDTLQAMGMIDAFDMDKADFSGMDGSQELYIGAVLHKAFVAVDEKCTEAAAATAVVMQLRAMTLPPTFRADHPFVFFIRENSTGSILFLGRMVQPSQ
ncbi:MAG: serpin family protein [Chloroflexi bacterium]|nr:serpin family protein [Chloroflexota bacterium]